VFFRLSEYELAARRHAFEAVEQLARARSPLLAQMRSERAEAIPVSRIVDEQGGELELAPVPVRIGLEMEIAPITAGDLGGVLAALDAAAAQQEEALSKALFSSLGEITKMTGNQVDAGGRPLSWDLIIDMLEELEIRFDDDGKMDLTLVMNPRDFERLERLGPPTPEQEARREAVLERKREEWQARRRQRRLR
jgi:hypothetical protein